MNAGASSNNTQWSLDFIIEKTNMEKSSCYFKNVGYRYQEVLGVERGLKIKLMKKFIDLFSRDKTGKELFDAINENFMEFRKSTKIDDDDDEFRKLKKIDDDDDDEFVVKTVAILFLDGCVILQFIHSYLNKKLEKFDIDIRQRRNMRDKVFERRQIPFRILELLVNSSNNPDQLKIDVVKFIHINNIIKISQYQVISPATCLAQWDDIVNIKYQDPQVEVDLRYLLYLLITSLDGHTISTNNDTKNKEETHQHVLCIPSFSWKRPKSKDLVATRYDITDNHGFFRHVEELKLAGIEFELSGCSLADISFSDSCFHLKGHLKLPPLIMDIRTRNKLEHLAWYEESIDDHRYVVTSYLKFMDILIDSEQDVKELRASRIIQSHQISDNDLAIWINKLGSELPEPPQDFYSEVKTQIQTHCGRKGAVWLNQVYRQRFSNPWAIMGLIAAVMILSLAVIQTVFTINPKK